MAINNPADMLTLERLTDFLELSVSCAVQACSQGLRYDFYEPRDRLSLLLLYAIVDYGRDVAVLAKGDRHSAIAILTRSALDAYADLANLCDHSNYWEHLVAADAQSWKKLLERASRGGNPMLKGLSEDKMLPVGRRKYAKELKALEAKGVTKLDIDDRFKRAGLTNEYESVYALPSAEVHNNVSGLQSRYIDWDDTSAWITPRGESSSHSHHYELPCTLTMSEVVLRSTEKVLRYLGHGVAVISEPLAELERIWKLAQAQEAREQAEIQAEDV